MRLKTGQHGRVPFFCRYAVYIHTQPQRRHVLGGAGLLDRWRSSCQEHTRLKMDLFRQLSESAESADRRSGSCLFRSVRECHVQLNGLCVVPASIVGRGQSTCDCAVERCFAS